MAWHESYISFCATSALYWIFFLIFYSLFSFSVIIFWKHILPFNSAKLELRWNYWTIYHFMISSKGNWIRSVSYFKHAKPLKANSWQNDIKIRWSNGSRSNKNKTIFFITHLSLFYNDIKRFYILCCQYLCVKCGRFSLNR